MLIVSIYVNQRLLMVGTALRIKGDEKPNTINTYRLHDGTTVKHRYGDGATKLAQKILKKLEK